MSVASVASGALAPYSRPSRRRDPGECGNSTGSHPIAPGDRSCASPISGSLCGVSHDRAHVELLPSAGFHSAWAACNEDADRRSRHFNACINGARIGTPGLARGSWQYREIQEETPPRIPVARGDQVPARSLASVGPRGCGPGSGSVIFKTAPPVYAGILGTSRTVSPGYSQGQNLQKRPAFCFPAMRGSDTLDLARSGQANGQGRFHGGVVWRRSTESGPRGAHPRALIQLWLCGAVVRDHRILRPSTGLTRICSAARSFSAAGRRSLPIARTVFSCPAQGYAPDAIGAGRSD